MSKVTREIGPVGTAARVLARLGLLYIAGGASLASVSRGARVDADVYRGTAIAWASSRGHLAAVRRLLDLGAAPDARTTFGGPDHGEAATALHLAAEGDRLDKRIVRHLSSDEDSSRALEEAGLLIEALRELPLPRRLV
jgi:ankyrin repeat protein